MLDAGYENDLAGTRAERQATNGGMGHVGEVGIVSDLVHLAASLVVSAIVIAGSGEKVRVPATLLTGNDCANRRRSHHGLRTNHGGTR